MVLSCEHASNHMPAPWSWPREDARLVDDHWAWDPGAAELTRALCARLGVGAVLANFSRLLIDPNRPLDSPTLFRDVADGAPVRLNEEVTDLDRQRRIKDWYTPFHAAYDRLVARHPGFALCSLHSFTPVYEGSTRVVEIGVLWDRDEAWGEAFAHRMNRGPWKVFCNEPYSGRAGLMYSAQRHADAHGRKAIEIEVRNDLLADKSTREGIADLIAATLRETLGDTQAG